MKLLLFPVAALLVLLLICCDILARDELEGIRTPPGACLGKARGEAVVLAMRPFAPLDTKLLIRPFVGDSAPAPAATPCMF